MLELGWLNSATLSPQTIHSQLQGHPQEVPHHPTNGEKYNNTQFGLDID